MTNQQLNTAVEPQENTEDRVTTSIPRNTWREVKYAVVDTGETVGEFVNAAVLMRLEQMKAEKK